MAFAAAHDLQVAPAEVMLGERQVRPSVNARQEFDPMRTMSSLLVGLLVILLGSKIRADDLPPVLPVLPASNHRHENLADLAEHRCIGV